MADYLRTVLFLSPGNAARNLLAEAILNHRGRGRFRAYSAGRPPAGRVHPLVPETLRTMRLPVEGLRSKSWDEFAAPGAPSLDFVILLRDKAAGEVAAAWPAHPITAQWQVVDPAQEAGSADRKRARFLHVAQALQRRIDLFALLPPAALDGLSLRTRGPATLRSAA